MQVPADLLALANAIEALFQENGSIDKARTDRASLLRSQQNHEHRAREIWKSLGRTDDLLTHVEALRLRADEPESIRQLGHQHARLLANRENTQERIYKLECELVELRGSLQNLPPKRDLSELRRLVNQTQKLGPVEDALNKTVQQITLLQKQADQVCQRLQLSPDSMESVLQLPVPNLESIDRFQQDFAKAQQKLDVATENQENLEADVDRLRAELQKLDLQTRSALRGRTEESAPAPR